MPPRMWPRLAPTTESTSVLAEFVSMLCFFMIYQRESWNWVPNSTRFHGHMVKQHTDINAVLGFSSKVLDLDIAPFLPEVLGDEPAMTMFRRCLTT